MGRVRGGVLGLWVVSLPGCGAAHSEQVAASSTVPTADPAPEARTVAAKREAPPSSPPMADELAALVGWWRSDSVCLELFANGDFEVSRMSAAPKVMIMGTAKITASGAGVYTLDLKPDRIWKGRYVSACRKHHETGKFVETDHAQGVPLKLGESGQLTVKRVGDAQIELCGTDCTTLTRETPALVARWRRAEMEMPDRPEKSWQAGDLLELKFDAQAGHLWTGLVDGSFARVHGTTVARYVSPDVFEVTFTAERAEDVTGSELPTVLGASLTNGVGQVLAVRRLAGERIEVCVAARCATLERQFDSYNYELD